MSKSFERYQVVLQNIPCYPEFTTSLEIRKILLNKDLLDASLAERSQMKTVQRIIAKVANDYLGVEIDHSTRPHQIRIAQFFPHPINPGAMSSVLSLQIIEHEVLKMLPPGMRKEVSNLLSTANTEHDKRLQLWKERFCYSPAEFQLSAPVFDPAYIEIIERAIIEKRTLTMTYKKRGSEQGVQYTVEPLGITLHGQSFYLLAVKENTDDYRTFAIHRIQAMKTGFSCRQPRTDFNSKAFIENQVPHFSGGKFIDVILKIDNYEGLHLIEETKLSDDQSILASDAETTTVQARVRESLGFEWWLMKNANIVEVVKPERIRTRIISNLNAALNKYKKQVEN